MRRDGRKMMVTAGMSRKSYRKWNQKTISGGVPNTLEFPILMKDAREDRGCPIPDVKSL